MKITKPGWYLLRNGLPARVQQITPGGVAIGWRDHPDGDLYRDTWNAATGQRDCSAEPSDADIVGELVLGDPAAAQPLDIFDLSPLREWMKLSPFSRADIDAAFPPGPLREIAKLCEEYRKDWEEWSYDSHYEEE